VRSSHPLIQSPCISASMQSRISLFHFSIFPLFRISLSYCCIVKLLKISHFQITFMQSCISTSIQSFMHPIVIRYSNVRHSSFVCAIVRCQSHTAEGVALPLRLFRSVGANTLFIPIAISPEGAEYSTSERSSEGVIATRKIQPQRGGIHLELIPNITFVIFNLIFFQHSTKFFFIIFLFVMYLLSLDISLHSINMSPTD